MILSIASAAAAAAAVVILIASAASIVGLSSILIYIPLSGGEKNSRPNLPRPALCSPDTTRVPSPAPSEAIFFITRLVESTVRKTCISHKQSVSRYFLIPSSEIISFSEAKQ